MWLAGVKRKGLLSSGVIVRLKVWLSRARDDVMFSEICRFNPVGMVTS